MGIMAVTIEFRYVGEHDRVGMTASGRGSGRESTPLGITVCPPTSSSPPTTYVVLARTPRQPSPVTNPVSRASAPLSNGADRRGAVHSVARLSKGTSDGLCM